MQKYVNFNSKSYLLWKNIWVLLSLWMRTTRCVLPPPAAFFVAAAATLAHEDNKMRLTPPAAFFVAAVATLAELTATL